MPLQEPFSKRNRYSGAAKEITVREDAPENLRYFVLQTAVDLDWGPSNLRTIVCRVLRVPPDESNWSEYPNVWGEVQRLVYGCDWFRVYDIIEGMCSRFLKNDREHGLSDAAQFSDALNGFFVEEGIGWQLTNGVIVTRGPEAFEAVVKEATSTLAVSQRPTAASHLHESLQQSVSEANPKSAGCCLSRNGLP